MPRIAWHSREKAHADRVRRGRHFHSSLKDFLVLSNPHLLRHFTFALAMGTYGVCYALISPCTAQMITIAPNPQVGEPVSSGFPASIITPATTPGLKSSVSRSSGTSLIIAGRGLPGMPGGPPLNAPIGAQDPTPIYMRPSVIGPLFCDPAINIVC